MSSFRRRTASPGRCSPHWLAPRRSCSSSPSVARLLCTETSTRLFPGHGWIHHGLTPRGSGKPVAAWCARPGGGERLMHREHRQGRKVLPSPGTALLGCDLCAAQGALPCMPPNHPCCSHVLLTCTAPSSSTLWALLQGLQGRLSHCGTSSPEPAINEGPFACHLSGLIRRAAPLFPSPALADLASHTHRSKTQRYRGSYQHILTKLTSAFLLRRVNQQANTTYCPNRSQPSSKIWGTVGAA